MSEKVTLEDYSLVAEWDYEKNGDLRPRDFTGGSNKKVWWRCIRGHSWQAAINNRVYNSGNCPYCANKKVWQGYNDIVTTHPKVAAEWDYEKNKHLRLEQFTAGSCTKAWWKCEYGHSWEAVINTRKKSRCPYCTGVRVITGVNDLLTVNPILAAEWDYAKNTDLRPDFTAAYSHKKVWWRCDKGHSWQAAISNRSGGNGCPYCANQKVLKGFNDLLSAAPELCKEWDYEKNGSLQPDEVVKNAIKSVWWKCKKGHSWKSGVGNRRRGSGCPVCAGHIIIPGKNDLKTLRPDLAEEWDYDKNGDLCPDSVAARTNKKVWWKCKYGHSYIASIAHKFNGSGCPYCGGDLPVIGENDLATVHPEIAQEWDYERNDLLRPENVTSGSFKKVWWKCKRGHHWETSINSRVRGTDCPHCRGKTPMKIRLVT